MSSQVSAERATETKLLEPENIEIHLEISDSGLHYFPLIDRTSPANPQPSICNTKLPIRISGFTQEKGESSAGTKLG